ESLDDGITWQAIYPDIPNDWEHTIYAGLFVVGAPGKPPAHASFSDVVVEDETDTMGGATNKSRRVQVALMDGSLLSAGAVSADESKIRIGFGNSNYVASVYAVARLVYRPVPERLKRELRPGRKGVLLKSGDF